MLLPPEAPVGLWPAMVAIEGPGGSTARHRHHGMHLVLARTGDLAVTVDDQVTRTAGILTPPDLPHAIDAGGTTVVILFVDPECDRGRSLRKTLDGRARAIDAGERDRLLADLPAPATGADLTAWIDRTLETLRAGAARRPIHPKVTRLLRLLADAPLEPAPSLASFADRVGLSASRLMHVFTESTGTPWRAYLRWLRFQRAAAAISRGTALTDAALEAGFHDAAHMTRTFKATYGLAPSQLRRPRDA